MDLMDHGRWNEEMAKKYNPDMFITKTGWVVRWVEKRRLHMTLNALQSAPDSSVLDLGCGSGNLLPLISAKRIVGVDPSDTLLNQARIRTAKIPNVELVKAFAEQLPFEAGTFDRIVCSEVMEHVRNPEQVLKEMKRVAKPGARIIITVPNETLINFTKKWVLRLGLKKWVAGEYPMSDNMLEEWHVSELEKETLKSLAQKYSQFIRLQYVPFPGLSYHWIMIFRTA